MTDSENHSEATYLAWKLEMANQSVDEMRQCQKHLEENNETLRRNNDYLIERNKQLEAEMSSIHERIVRLQNRTARDSDAMESIGAIAEKEPPTPAILKIRAILNRRFPKSEGVSS